MNAPIYRQNTEPAPIYHKPTTPTECNSREHMGRPAIPILQSECVGLSRGVSEK